MAADENLTTSRLLNTLAHDIENKAATITTAVGDYLLVYDISVGKVGRVAISSLNISDLGAIAVPVIVGSDGTGYDVLYYSATAGKSWLWDESADKMIVTGASQLTGDVTVGVDATGHDVIMYGDTTGKSWMWDQSADKMIVTGTSTFTEAITPTGGVAAAGGFTASPRLCHTGGVPGQISTEGTDLSVVVTELYLAEVFIPANCTVTGAAVLWGSATEGNAKVMLFNSSGTRVAISASTDVSGYTIDSYGSRIAFASPYAAVGPATYYVGVMGDSASNRINTHILGNFGAGKITALVYGTEAGYASVTPPTTFTTGLGPIATLY